MAVYLLMQMAIWRSHKKRKNQINQNWRATSVWNSANQEYNSHNSPSVQARFRQSPIQTNPDAGEESRKLEHHYRGASTSQTFHRHKQTNKSVCLAETVLSIQFKGETNKRAFQTALWWRMEKNLQQVALVNWTQGLRNVPRAACDGGWIWCGGALSFGFACSSRSWCCCCCCGDLRRSCSCSAGLHSAACNFTSALGSHFNIKTRFLSLFTFILHKHVQTTAITHVFARGLSFIIYWTLHASLLVYFFYTFWIRQFLVFTSLNVFMAY